MVKNEFPKFTSQPYRIAFVGEAPGSDEESEGRPFVGYSGRLLWAEAGKAGIVRDACFVGNVCQHRPPKNNIKAFDWNGPEIRHGIAQLEADLQQYKPNLVILLGNAPLRWATGEESGITLWRGSIIRSQHGYKCLAALHPAGILREYQNKPLLKFDLKRARLEGMSPIINNPERNLDVNLGATEILVRLAEIKQHRKTISIDIEGYVDNMTCISIAEHPTQGFIIPFNNKKWEDHIEAEVFRALASVLSDPNVPKILQNSLYDTFVLQYGYNIPVRGVIDDTMLAHWEMFCEMRKSLAFQASIYTREPYWKEERDDEDQLTRWRYCCKDSAVTYEIRDVLNKQLHGQSKNHYRFNMGLLDPLLYMEIKGINYDKEKANQKLKDCTTKIHRLQWALNELASLTHPTTVAEWVTICRDTLCFKRESAYVNLARDIVSHAKNTTLDNAIRAEQILTQTGELSIENHGELSILTNHCLNVESKDQVADFLYRDLGLPIQYKKEHGRKTEKETTDVLALLNLYAKTQNPVLKLILSIRALRTRSESLAARTDADGRIRCGYNLVGTETGRLSCYTSPTGSGFNLQTVTKKDRDRFLPDNGYWFFQCDLSGADGWTVAAHCADCGDPTMLEDYCYGLKPARILSLILMYGRDVLSWSRDKIKEKSREVDSDGWMYFACKRIQHGTNYGMRQNTMSDQILKDSYKLFGEPVVVTPAQCAIAQSMYMLRYPGIVMWHRKIKHLLKTQGYLVSASGHRRDFFGRHDDYQTFKDACADEPQNNTTYVTNLALERLWKDPENRLRTNDESSSRILLRIQPNHLVHDALNGQFPKADTPWAISKIKSYFDNEIIIAGQRIVIPFEGAYGPSWGQLGAKYGGGVI